jgi:hypothetical protein
MPPESRRAIGLVAVTFRYPARLARGVTAVALVGSFNGWSPAAHPMRQAANRDWAITVYLSPSRVVYLFWADGALRPDPADDERIPNGWGAEYSVRYVTMAGSPAEAAHLARRMVTRGEWGAWVRCRFRPTNSCVTTTRLKT